MTKGRSLLAALAAIAGLAVSATGAQAAAPCTKTWTGSTGGDWDLAGNWSPAGVPVAGADVCIESGSAVLTGTDTPPPAGGFGSVDVGGNSGANAGLTIGIHNVVTAATTTIGPHAAVTLDGTYYGANAGNASLGGGTVLNQGTLTMQGTGYSATLYGTVTNQGTITVPFGDVSFGQGSNGGTGSLTNQGTISVAAPSATYPHDPATISVSEFSLTNQGGTIANAGTINVTGGDGITSMFTQGAGTITGNAVNLGRASALAWSGSGAGGFYVGSAIGNVPMSGNIAAGQNVTVALGTALVESSSFTSAGSILLNGNYYGGGGGPAAITTSSGTFTNAGTLTAESNDNDPALNGNVVNQGTITVLPNTELEQTSGNFVNSGTLTPEISSSALGAFRFDNGVSFTAGGTLLPTLEGGFTPAAGQVFPVIRGSGLHGSFAAVGGGFHADYGQSGVYDAVYGPAPAPTPTPTPSPNPSPAPATVQVGSVSGGAGSIRIVLRCPTGHGACGRMGVRVTTTEHLRGGRLVAVSAAARRRTRTTTKVVTIASGSVASLAAGRSRTLTLTLNRTGLALVRRHHPLPARVAVTEHGTRVRTVTIAVRPPARPRRRR